jgi:hypothetical protein
MLTLRPALACALLTLLTACATPDAAEVTVAEAAPADMVCNFEAPTGTTFKRKRCMSKEDYARTMETAQRTASEIKMPPPDQR